MWKHPIEEVISALKNVHEFGVITSQLRTWHKYEKPELLQYIAQLRQRLLTILASEQTLELNHPVYSATHKALLILAKHWPLNGKISLPRHSLDTSPAFIIYSATGYQHHSQDLTASIYNPDPIHRRDLIHFNSLNAAKHFKHSLALKIGCALPFILLAITEASLSLAATAASIGLSAFVVAACIIGYVISELASECIYHATKFYLHNRNVNEPVKPANSIDRTWFGQIPPGKVKKINTDCLAEGEEEKASPSTCYASMWQQPASARAAQSNVTEVSTPSLFALTSSA